PAPPPGRRSAPTRWETATVRPGARTDEECAPASVGPGSGPGARSASGAARRDSRAPGYSASAGWSAPVDTAGRRSAGASRRESRPACKARRRAPTRERDAVGWAPHRRTWSESGCVAAAIEKARQRRKRQARLGRPRGSPRGRHGDEGGEASFVVLGAVAATARGREG